MIGWTALVQNRSTHTVSSPAQFLVQGLWHDDTTVRAHQHTSATRTCNLHQNQQPASYSSGVQPGFISVLLHIFLHYHSVRNITFFLEDGHCSLCTSNLQQLYSYSPSNLISRCMRKRRHLLVPFFDPQIFISPQGLIKVTSSH